MSYSTKNIIADAGSKPIPQYFNIGADAYEAVQGISGGIYTVQLISGSAISATNPMPSKLIDASVMQPVDIQAIYYKSQTGVDAIPVYSPEAIQGNTDVTPNTPYGLPVSPMQLLYNDGTVKWERARNNSYGTALASAARTATPAVSNLINYNSKGVMVYLNVTVASGTGGLTLTMRATELVASNPVQINTSPTAVTATGTYAYVIYPSATSGSAFTQPTNAPLPYKWSINIAHGDASSYTYSVSYAYLS